MLRSAGRTERRQGAMTRHRYKLGLMAALCMSVPAAAQQPAPPVPKLAAMPVETQKHIAAGEMLVRQGAPKSAIGEFFNTSRNSGYVPPSLLSPPDNPPGQRAVLMPTRAFDQLYYVGNVFVGSWVLVTDGGIILWDAMDNADEAEHIVEAGIRTLGLDPAATWVKTERCASGNWTRRCRLPSAA
jgi:metallo-beta-lactamase class B